MSVWCARHPTALFLLQTTTLLITFVVFQYVLERATAIRGESYFEPALLLELARRLGPWLLALAALFAFVLLRFGALAAPWSHYENGASMRNATFALAALIAWPFLTMTYNPYFAQAYPIDRLALLLLVPLVWWRPMFLLGLLPVISLLMGQLIEPTLGGTILAHKLQVTHALGLVAAAIIVHGATGQRSTTPLIFLFACFAASQYWLPAWAKLQLDWLANDSLHHVLLGAYAYGWLNFLTPDEIVTWAHKLIPLEWPMRIGVIAIEGGCLFLLWRRTLARVLLVAAMAFHIGVFVLGGLLFWTWIALDAALLLLLYRADRWPDIHRNVPFALSLILILACPLWARPPALGWYVAPLYYSYRIDATLADGRTLTLSPEFFSPYEDVFATTSFSYASRGHGVLVSTHGVTRSLETVRALEQAHSAAEVFALEGQTNRYNQELADRLSEFLLHFAGHHNRDGERYAWLRALQPPLQNYALMPGTVHLGHEKIRTLALTEVTTFYDGERLENIRELELARLDAGPTPLDSP